MLVQFGAKLQSGNLVVRPARERRGPLGDIVAKIPALRVEYSNHFWNSESDDCKAMYRRYAEAMNDLNQPNNEGGKFTVADAQKMVESFVTEHPWRKRVDGSRIFIMDDHGEVIQPSEIEATCLTIKYDEESGDATVCGKPVEPGTNKCAECLAALAVEEGASV